MLSTKLGKWDVGVCVLVGVLAAALVWLLAQHAAGGAAQVVISQGGETLYSVPLSGEARDYAVQGDYPLTVHIEDGQVRVTRASCPGQDCMEQGAISAPGQTIACLPDRVTVAIQGDGGTDVTIG